MVLFAFLLVVGIGVIESNTTHRLSCPRPHTGDYFDIACADGSKCSWYKDGWDCCVGKGGKTNCPEQQPFLCSKPDACSDGKEFCCSPTEEGCESQNAGSVMCPGELLPVSFNGLCRFGDKKKNDMMSKRTNSPLICQEWCQDTKNCVAFDFAKSRTKDCTLYEGGPYTYGWEMYKKKDLNRCYLMTPKERSTSCSAWQDINDTNYGCTGNNNDWSILSYRLSFDDTAQCQSLCQQQEENGCCTISKKYGCLWLPGGTVTTAADYGELAISCSLKN